MTPLSPEKRSLRLRLGIGVVLVGTTSFVSGAATGFSVHPQRDAVQAGAPMAGPVSSAAARTASTSGECVTPSHTRMAEAPAAHTSAAEASAVQTPAAPVEAAPASGLHASGPTPGDESAPSGGAWVDAEPAPRWMIQVGAFSEDGNAQALASRLESKGYEPLIVAARSRSGAWLQHVRLDFAGDENTAVARAREFEQTEGLTVVVVAIGPDGERLH